MKTGETKIKIHVKRLPRRNDSMFYFGKHIATLTKGNQTIVVEASGEMQVYFSERKDDCYANAQLAKELRNRKITDRGLSKLGENDMIQMNNWFRIFSDNDPTDLHEDIAHTYDDAIALAKERLSK